MLRIINEPYNSHINNYGITKSVNSADQKGKSSDRIGETYVVKHGNFSIDNILVNNIIEHYKNYISKN